MCGMYIAHKYGIQFDGYRPFSVQKNATCWVKGQCREITRARAVKLVAEAVQAFIDDEVSTTTTQRMPLFGD